MIESRIVFLPRHRRRLRDYGPLRHVDDHEQGRVVTPGCLGYRPGGLIDQLDDDHRGRWERLHAIDHSELAAGTALPGFAGLLLAQCRREAVCCLGLLWLTALLALLLAGSRGSPWPWELAGGAILALCLLPGLLRLRLRSGEDLAALTTARLLHRPPHRLAIAGQHNVGERGLMGRHAGEGFSAAVLLLLSAVALLALWLRSPTSASTVLLAGGIWVAMASSRRGMVEAGRQARTAALIRRGRAWLQHAMQDRLQLRVLGRLGLARQRYLRLAARCDRQRREQDRRSGGVGSPELWLLPGLAALALTLMPSGHASGAEAMSIAGLMLALLCCIDLQGRRCGMGIVAWQRVRAIDSRAPATHPEETVATPVAAGKGAARGSRIEVAGLSFRYPASRPVLSDAQMHIEAGETVLLTGPSGSGKTTLIRLLLGLLEADAGRIRIDGVDPTGADGEALRRRIGLATQGALAQHGRVRGLLLGEASLPDSLAWEALDLVGAAAWVAARAEGLDILVLPTEFDRRQRQQLVLARAVLGLPPLVVLDEALIELRPQEQRRLLQGLRGAGCTVVIISHLRGPDWPLDRIVAVTADGGLAEQPLPDAAVPPPEPPPATSAAAVGPSAEARAQSPYRPSFLDRRRSPSGVDRALPVPPLWLCLAAALTGTLSFVALT